jgi:hypothetical protein
MYKGWGRGEDRARDNPGSSLVGSPNLALRLASLGNKNPVADRSLEVYAVLWRDQHTQQLINLI